MNQDIQTQINRNNENIQILNNRKVIYDNFLGLLYEFKKHLLDLQQNFNKASNAFINGGYICDGVTLDNGVLAQLYQNTQNDIIVIMGMINNVSEELIRIDDEVSNLQQTNQSLMSQ